MAAGFRLPACLLNRSSNKSGDMINEVIAGGSATPGIGEIKFST
jgi:hypothetical protein